MYFLLPIRFGNKILIFEDTYIIFLPIHVCMYESFRGGGLRVKIGHHKIGACAEIGQNRIRGGWGVKKSQKTSDIIYVRSLTPMTTDKIPP